MKKSHLINKKNPNLYFLLFTLQITNEYVFGTLEFYLSVCFVIEIQENLLNDGSVLGLVGLIDAKGSDVAQPIWP